MIPLLQTLTWAVVWALGLWRLDVLAHAWLDRAAPAPVRPEELVVPHDIQSAAARWADDHARAAHLARAVELYHEHKDWDTVRLAMREAAT